MEIKVLNQNEEIVVAIEGRIDTITASELEDAVQPYFSKAGITLVFDCEKVSYVSSSGLRIILMAHKQVTARGGKFIVRNLTPEVRAVIDMTGFSRILIIQ